MKRLLSVLSLSLAAVVPASALIVAGNGATGFGGPIGGGSLEITDDGVNVTFTVTRGTDNFNDALVFYFDSVSGGVASLATSGDVGNPFVGRRAITNEFGSGVTFPSGFNSDFAFALRVNGSSSNHLFQTNSNNPEALIFVATSTVSNFGNVSASSYSFVLPVTSLGLTANSGASFAIVTTYLNPNDGAGSDSSFRSNEAFAASLGGSNVGFDNITFPAGSVINYTIIPEPSTYAALFGLVVLGFAALRRRR